MRTPDVGEEGTGSPESPGTSREARLNHAIAGYLESREAGTEDREALLASHPDLREDLEQFLADRDYLESLEGMLALRPSPAPADSPQPAPERGVESFGDYEILSEIARGGMGVVYHARQKKLGREVALKMVLGGRLATSEDLARFRAEARLAAGLNHPNIIPIHDVGEIDGRLYYSMKLMEGGSLARNMAPCREDPRLAARLIEQVARAVHHAHERGLLHRDLKPGNILLDEAGTPHVSDFGLAKLLEADAGLTLSGAVIGTPRYMAPEQAASSKGGVTTAADVYSLGAILYELLTGRAPFDGESSAEILRQAASEEPQLPSRLSRRVPRDIETICLKCLEKQPSRRYPSALLLAEDLGRFVRGEPILARPSSTPERIAKWVRRRPAAAALLLVSLSALLGFAGLTLRHNAELRQRAARAEADARLRRDILRRYQNASVLASSYRSWARRECNVDDVARLGSLEPGEDGGDPGGFAGRYLRRVLDLQRFKISLGEEANRPVCYAPDGKTVAVGDGSEVMIRDAASGALVETLGAGEGNATSIAFSPDGQTLAVGQEGSSRARRMDLGTGRESRTPHAGHDKGTKQLAFSPDGKTLALVHRYDPIRLFESATCRAAGALGSSKVDVMCIAFLPDGETLASSGDDLNLVIWDLPRLLPRRTLSLKKAFQCLAPSPDGKRIAGAANDDPAIHIIEIESGEESLELKGHGRGIDALAYSPDGRSIASGSMDHCAILWDPDSGARRIRLEPRWGYIYGLAFSPSSQRLAIASLDGFQIWEAGSRAEPLALLGHGNSVSILGLSPDQRTLWTASEDWVLKVWDLSALPEGGEVREVASYQGGEAGYREAVLAPCGEEVALGRADGGLELWSFKIEGSTLVPRVEARLPGEAPDLKALILSSDAEDLAVVSKGKEGKDRVVLWEKRQGGGAAWEKSGGFDLPCEAWGGEFSRDHRLLALGQRESLWVFLWDVVRRRELGRIPNREGVLATAFSPDSSLLAIGNAANTVSVWKLDPEGAAPVELTSYRAHDGEVRCLAFFPDGRELVTGSEDGTLKLWDLVTAPEGTVAIERGALREHTRLKTLAVSSRGDLLISGGGGPGQGEVRLWRGFQRGERGR